MTQNLRPAQQRLVELMREVGEVLTKVGMVYEERMRAAEAELTFALARLGARLQKESQALFQKPDPIHVDLPYDPGAGEGEGPGMPDQGTIEDAEDEVGQPLPMGSEWDLFAPREEDPYQDQAPDLGEDRLRAEMKKLEDTGER